MMNYIQEAKNNIDEMIVNRRHLHENPEVGFDLPETSKYVKEKLQEYGIEPQDIGENGVTAVIGKPGGKTVLLRADMDALPIKEDSGEEFASTNGNMHACGHDIHTTMLLQAAKLLKQNEENLEGQVKFIFQPAEEFLYGAKTIVDAGILENPKVDVAMGMHVWPNAEKPGIAFLPTADKQAAMAAAINFRVKIQGKGTHGAMPFKGIDPVYIGSKLVTGLPEILAREVPFDRSASITVGKFIGDGAMNVIPDTAELEGTIRTFSNETHDYILERFQDMVKQIAETYRGTAEVEIIADVPAMSNDLELQTQGREYIEELAQGNFEVRDMQAQNGSEDFAHYANAVPGMFYILEMPDPRTDTHYNVHHPKVTFDEEMMPYGSGTIAHAATRYLEENK